MLNHYFNQSHPLKPYTHSLEATEGTLPPSNAIRDKEPTIVQGKWPCWNGKDWIQVEDHRERESYPELVARYGEHYPQKATEYWLAEDTHDTPARTMKDLGALPDGALLERPALPPPTLAEVSAAKYAEIINGANAALNEAQAYYSAIEIGTWSEQETGAIAIKGLDASVATKPEVVIMLGDPVAVQKSVERVKGIAANKGTTPEELAERILSNAQTAKCLIDRTLKQQNCYERQLQDFSIVKDSETEADVIGWIEAMVIDYSVDAGTCDGE